MFELFHCPALAAQSFRETAVALWWRRAIAAYGRNDDEELMQCHERVKEVEGRQRFRGNRWRALALPGLAALARGKLQGEGPGYPTVNLHLSRFGVDDLQPRTNPPHAVATLLLCALIFLMP